MPEPQEARAAAGDGPAMLTTPCHGQQRPPATARKNLGGSMRGKHPDFAQSQGVFHPRVFWGRREKKSMFFLFMALEQGKDITKIMNV